MKLSLGLMNNTSGLREVQFPRKNSPREAKLEIFLELEGEFGRYHSYAYYLFFHFSSISLQGVHLAFPKNLTKSLIKALPPEIKKSSS